jgi:selenoprotein W-related protein
MTQVDIEYCVPCGHLDRAQDLQEAILSTHGRDVEGVRLVTGDGGTFTVDVAGERVFDVDEEGYDREAIVERVGDRL